MPKTMSLRFSSKRRGTKSSENDQLTGHFQSVFFNISRKNSITSIKVNQQPVLNLEIFYHFPKNLDRTIHFNSVTLKNTQTEPQKYFFFQQTNNI